MKKSNFYHLFSQLALALVIFGGVAFAVSCGSCDETTPCLEQQCKFCNLETNTCEDCCNQPLFACDSPCVVEDDQCRNFSGDTCNMIPEIPSGSARYLPWLLGSFVFAGIALFSFRKKKRLG